MTQTSPGLDSIYEALENIDHEMAGNQRAIAAIGIDAESFIEENRPQFRRLLDEFDAMAEHHGTMITMMAARLFIEVQKYRLRREPCVAEFDGAFAEAARMLAQTFVLIGC
jgi:hypothetical protein